MKYCIWNNELIDINDYLLLVDSEEEIRTASENGELKCVDPNCKCRILEYCHGQIRNQYLRHKDNKDNVECCFEQFEKSDTIVIKKIRDAIFELFRNRNCSIKQFVKFPNGKCFAHLLLESGNKKIVLQIADKSLSLKKRKRIELESENSGFILRWIVIGNINCAQDDIENYQIARNILNKSSEQDLLIVDADAKIISQTRINRDYDRNQQEYNFRLNAPIEQLVLKDRSFCIDNFDDQYNEWLSEQRTRQEKEKQSLHSINRTGFRTGNSMSYGLSNQQKHTHFQSTSYIQNNHQDENKVPVKRYKHTAPTSKDVNEYTVGKRIVHSKAGNGIIVEVGKLSNSAEHFIRIDFGLNGIKDYNLEQLIRAQTISFC